MGRMSELAAELGAMPEPTLPGPQQIIMRWSPEDGVWRAWYDGDGDPDGMEMGDGSSERAAIDELTTVHPRPGAQCGDCFFIGPTHRTPWGMSACASCEGTGAQLSTSH